MEPPDHQELNDLELTELLREWKTPPVPERLRNRVSIEARKPWWLRMWTASVRIPVPLAIGVILAFIFLALWRPVRTQPKAVAPTFYGLRPVGELRPRIIRSGNVRQ